MSARHSRPESPKEPNTILHTGARPLPDGNIEMMTIIRMDDCNYQFSKIVSLTEYQVIVEGLDLCVKTAVHQARQRAVKDSRAADDDPTPVPEPTAAPTTPRFTPPPAPPMPMIPPPAPPTPSSLRAPTPYPDPDVPPDESSTPLGFPLPKITRAIPEGLMGDSYSLAEIREMERKKDDGETV